MQQKQISKTTDDVFKDIIGYVSENKNLTAPEIRRAVVQKNNDPILVDRVMGAMIRSHTYFDRNNGRGGGIRYSVKKEVMKKMNKDGSIKAVGNFNELAQLLKENQTVVNVLSSPDNNVHAKSVEQTPVTTPAPVSAINTDLIFDPKNDSIDLAIWKVMKDGELYSAPELMVLLDGAEKFTVSSVSPHLTVLRREKRLVEAVERQGKLIKYRLIPGVERPANLDTKPMIAVTRNRTKPSKRLGDDPTVPPTTQIKENEETMATRSNPIPKTPAPLLQATIKIKGIDFTLTEIATMYDYFTNTVRIGIGMNEAMAATVGLKFQLRGETFDVNEIRDLMKAIRDQGIVKDTSGLK